MKYLTLTLSFRIDNNAIILGFVTVHADILNFKEELKQ